MSSTHDPTDPDRRPFDDFDRSLLRPPVSAADVGRSGRARVHFDHRIGVMMEEEARERAPAYSFDRHLIGLSGEVATAVWQDVSIDRRIFPDYQGDDGYDLEVPVWYRDDPLRVEVKTSGDCSSPEGSVSRAKIDQADLFVLCSTPDPTLYVEIVGCVTRPILTAIGEAHGRGGYLLSPEYLNPVNPVHYSPQDVRDVLHRRFRSGG